MTVEEFRKLPKDDGPVYHELRHGAVAAVSRPTLKYIMIRRRLQRLLEAIAGDAGIAATGLSLRSLPEHELRIADVAYVQRERWEQTDPEDNLQGAPELVIEILSASKTAAETYDKEKLCLENGCLEFWVVDPDRGQVKVSTPDGHTRTWQAGQEIPLPIFGGASLAVAAIFE